MKLAMIPSAYRTIFFHAVATRLETAGHEVFWLSPNTRWAQWLVREGVRSSHILDVSRYGREWTTTRAPAPEEMERLGLLEAGGTLRINDILLMDPLLVRRPRHHALKYLATCERLAREFIVSNDIGCVTAEQTWAFELLVGQVCVTLGIPHMMPHTTRIPDSRFGFFIGHRETDLLSIRNPSSEDIEAASAFLGSFRARKPRPSYMAIDRRVLKPEIGRLKTLTRHVLDLAGDVHDETSYPPAGLIATHSKQVLRGLRNRRSRRFDAPALPPGRPFVFFPLHLQPEASIDIKGSPFTPQLEIVRAMARTLPLSHDLYVKEHSVALKSRPSRFYSDLSRIPGVRLISPFVDPFQLISAADLVVTITGTAAFEAALLGRPAATIAPIFFDPIVTRPRFNPFLEPLSGMLEPHGSSRDDDDRLAGFLAWLIAQSFPGTVGDAFWQPESMLADNLDRVAAGFATALDKLSRTC